jgi:hypothetical protein
MKKILLMALTVAVLTAAPAWAYIPPSSYIVKSIATKHGGLKGARVRSVVTQMEGEKLGSAHFKAVTYYNPQTQTLRAYALDDRNQKLYAVERRPDAATGADALLFWSNPHALALALRARGVPIRTEDELSRMKDQDERRDAEMERLARWSGGVAWVIGKDKEPQLWVEKDTFLPLRLIASPQPEADLVQLEMEGQRFYHEFPFPRVVTVVKKKEALLRDEVQDVTLSAETAEFKSPLTPGFTDAGNSAPSALRDLIRQYFEAVR